MRNCYKTVYDFITQSFDLSEEQLFDQSQGDRLNDCINARTAKYPLIYVPEFETVSAHFDQNGMDLRNEVRCDFGFRVALLSKSVDELVDLESVLTAKFADAQKLSEVSDDRSMQFASLGIDGNVKILRANDNKFNFYRSIVFFKCIDVILPKAIENPIKIELDREVQLQVMRHLSVLDELHSAILKEISAIDTADSSSDANDRYERLLKQKADLEEQVASMYNFKNLCAAEISLDDSGFIACCKIMKDNKYDLAKATEAYKQQRKKKRAEDEAKRRQEEERERLLRKYFGKAGDEVLNRYTDAIVADIKNRLGENLKISVYGGSTFNECLRLAGEKKITYPYILVNDVFRFYGDFNIKSYTNLNSEGDPVVHSYNTNALPCIYGIDIIIESQSTDDVSEIQSRIKTLYADAQINIPDVLYPGEVHPIKITLDTSRESQGHVFFANTTSVYYPKDYSEEDLADNHVLQYRLLQQAHFMLVCRKLVLNAINQLDTQYLKLIDGKQPSFFGRVFSSENFGKLKECFLNGTPIDRSLFNSVLDKLTSVYPSMYDKVMEGWAYEKIKEDLNGYFKVFNDKANSLFVLLGVPEEFEGIPRPIFEPDNWVPRGSAAFNFYFSKLRIANPSYSLQDAMEEFRQQLLVKQQEIRESNREFVDGMIDNFIDNGRQVRNTAFGVALGNKLSSGGGRRDGRRDGNRAGKKDMFGTSVCQRCHSPKNSMNQFTCMGCPVEDRCTKQTR